MVDQNEDSSEVSVGTGNDARVAMLERINDVNDGVRADELANVNDDGTTEAYIAPDLTPSDDDGVTKTEMDRMTAEVTEEEPVAPPPTKFITRKVNGRDLTLTEDEWIMRGMKVEAADQYLSEAARLRREAEQLHQTPAPSQPDVQVNDVENLRARVRAIQMGTEEEAMAALQPLLTPRAPQLSQDDMARAVDERLTFKEAVNAFQREFQDILSDPMLRDMALRQDQDLLNRGDKRGYAERFTEIGQGLRNWRNQLIQSNAPSADPMIAKTVAKAEATKRNVPKPANVKASSAMTDDGPEESVSDTIAAIAKARGGPQWSRA